MLTHAKKRQSNQAYYVRAIFERLPIKEKSISLVAASYALRDSTDKPRTYNEINYALRSGGRVLVIDIGKPDNPIVQIVFSLFMRYIVPIIAGLVTKYGYRNPWSVLYQTYELLPPNRSLKMLLEKFVGPSETIMMAMGGLIIASATKEC
jgi:demethylmenaquinone methyltransferase/2-methoxy-6-polyprenyl-1,4-benzoquinol methylase